MNPTDKASVGERVEQIAEKDSMEKEASTATTSETQRGDSPEFVLTGNQRDILYHTEHRAAGGLYCGRDKDMDVLVEAGLMEYAGKKSFVPDPYYRITGKGRAALRAGESINSGGNV